MTEVSSQSDSLDTHPLDYAITGCSILHSLQRHTLQGAKAILQSSLLKPISHADKSPEEFVKPSAINADNADLRRMLKEIDKVGEQCRQNFKEQYGFYRASLEMSGYDASLQQKYFTTADDVLSERQTLDHFRLEYILKKFEALGNDEKSGGEARLQNTFNAGDKQLELAIKKMQQKLSQARADVVNPTSLKQIESAAKATFEKKRDSYTAAIKEARQTTLAKESKWRSRDAEERNAHMQHWQNVINTYNKDGSDFHSKLIQNRDDINARLQRFCDRYCDFINRHIDYRSQIPTEQHQIHSDMTQWKLDTIYESEEWLRHSEASLEETYETSIEELRDEVAKVKQQLTELHLYRMKVKHLMYVDRMYQQNVMKDHKTECIPNDAEKYKELSSRIAALDLGSRIESLCRNGDTSTDQCYEMLVQLFFATHPDTVLLKKLNHVVRHYAR